MHSIQAPSPWIKLFLGESCRLPLILALLTETCLPCWIFLLPQLCTFQENTAEFISTNVNVVQPFQWTLAHQYDYLIIKYVVRICIICHRFKSTPFSSASCCVPFFIEQVVLMNKHFFELFQTGCLLSHLYPG